MKELIEKFNQLKIQQTDWYEEQDFGEELNEVFNKDCKIVETELDVDKHRWYETSLIIYEFKGGYFGIRFVTQTYDEISTYADIGWELKAFPMKKVQTVTYQMDHDLAVDNEPL